MTKKALAKMIADAVIETLIEAGFYTADGELAEPYRRGLVLPGWTCSACLGFNGEAREKRTECRACGTPATK